VPEAGGDWYIGRDMACEIGEEYEEAEMMLNDVRVSWTG
jgi:hypothetical protein